MRIMCLPKNTYVNKNTQCSQIARFPWHFWRFGLLVCCPRKKSNLWLKLCAVTGCFLISMTLTTQVSGLCARGENQFMAGVLRRCNAGARCEADDLIGSSRRRQVDRLHKQWRCTQNTFDVWRRVYKCRAVCSSAYSLIQCVSVFPWDLSCLLHGQC